MNILITGAEGQLGTELRHLLDSRKITYLATGSKELDITDAEAVNKYFDEHHPELVYDCAAFTAVDAAEGEPGSTLNRLVNVEGTRNLAEAVQRANAIMVYVSTDYVFDGSNLGMYDENDQTNPKNEYGRAKRDGELIVANTVERHYIVRTSWVFGEYGKNFVYTMMRLAKTHDELSVVNDQVGRPTWTKTLSEFMMHLVDNHVAFGLYQLSNKGQCTWYEFACEILKDTEVKIHAVDSTQFPQKAYRPKHSVMSLQKAESTQFEIMSWKHALGEFLSDIR